MNLGEKIKNIFKNIFKNIGKKQQALPEGNIKEEMPVDEKPKTFKEELIFDDNDLLDPRVCQGKQLIPNILQHLGVNKDIVNNPKIADFLRGSCLEMLHMRGYTNLGNLDGQYTKEEIDVLVKGLQKCKIIPDVSLEVESLDKTTRNMGFYDKETRSYSYRGMSIDETGNISFQHLKGYSPYGLKAVSISENAYSLDESGNVVSNSVFRSVNEKDSGGISSLKGIINRDGVLLKQESQFVNKTEGIKDNDTSSVETRDPEYPLIASVEKFNGNEKTASYYYPISSSDLDTMRTIDKMDEESGEIKSVVFKNREEAVAYCEENKGKILDEVGKWSKYKNGIMKIAMKAGIIQKEQEV